MSNRVGCDRRARASLSPTVLLTGGICRADPTRATPFAVFPINAACEPIATTAGVGVLGEVAPSHAHNATPQTPAVANTLTATAALRNLRYRFGEFCPARCGLDVKETALIA